MIKKVLPALTVLAVCVGTAHAQSSVTLYGTLDNAVAYYNNVGHASLLELQGSDLTTNSWGLKGKEDLGGGLKAIFKLENGFNVNTGKLSQGGREFGKNAWVGLASDSLGQVTFGRQLDTTVDLVQPLTADGYGPAFSTPGDVDNNDNTFRIQNAIKYASPTYSGFQYELMYGLGGVAGNVTSQQSSSAALAYANGGFAIAAGYVYVKNDGPGGAGTADQTQNNSVSPLFGAVAFTGSRLISQAAIQYAWGPFTANARYSNAQWKPTVLYAAFNRKETFNTGAASFNYQATKALALNIGYTYMKSSGASSATYHTVAAGADYNIAKRTTVYLIGAYSHARGTTFSEDGNSLMAAGGTVADLAPSSSTPSQVALMLGLTTKF